VGRFIVLATPVRSALPTVKASREPSKKLARKIATLVGMTGKRSLGLCAVLICACCTGCGQQHASAVQGSAGTLAVSGWSEELGERTLPEFERRHGVRVTLDPIVDNSTLETRLLVGRSGYDVVMPTDNFLKALIAAGALRKLDRALLPNWRNIDPAILEHLNASDPRNQYAVPYAWGTIGLGLNVEAVERALGRVPPRSLQLLFDAENARRLASCGVVWPDGGGWIMTTFATIAMGRDPSLQTAADLPAVEAALMRVRPHVRYIDSRPDSDLANGQICLTLGPSEGMAKARDAAAQAGRGVRLEYVLPEEGGLIWIDVLAIPADAQNVAGAHRFIDYLLEPEVIAEVTNTAKVANANLAARSLVSAAIREDRAIYPADADMRKLHHVPPEQEDYVRERTRMWTRVRTAGH